MLTITKVYFILVSLYDVVIKHDTRSNAYPPDTEANPTTLRRDVEPNGFVYCDSLLRTTAFHSAGCSVARGWQGIV